jgi:hypothetical protein
VNRWNKQLPVAAAAALQTFIKYPAYKMLQRAMDLHVFFGTTQGMESGQISN